MKYDNEMLKSLYNTHSLDQFLKLVDEEDIEDPRVRAILSTLRRSLRTLHLQFNPVPFEEIPKKSQESNPPQH